MYSSLNKKILIVDDSESVSESFADFFRTKGFIVLQAYDGSQGIKLALEHSPDLILMDLHMPVLTGHEATRIITFNPYTCDIPVVIFTTELEKENVKRALMVGARDYVIKTEDKEFVLKRLLPHLGIQ